MPGEKRIQSVGNAARLLKELARVESPMRLNDLSERLNMNKSSVHLLLATLSEAGFVEQTTQGTYRLGLGLFEVGSAALHQYGLGSLLTPVIESLAEATREAVTLAVLHEREVLLVQRLESDHVLRASIRVGTRMPLDASASGRAILAFLPQEERDKRLNDLELTPAVLKKVRRRVQQIRDAGFEEQRNEWASGVSSIAAPVFGLADYPVAALSVSTPTVRFLPEPWVKPLLACAGELSVLTKSMSVRPRQLLALLR